MSIFSRECQSTRMPKREVLSAIDPLFICNDRHKRRWAAYLENNPTVEFSSGTQTVIVFENLRGLPRTRRSNGRIPCRSAATSRFAWATTSRLRDGQTRRPRTLNRCRLMQIGAPDLKPCAPLRRRSTLARDRTENSRRVSQIVSVRRLVASRPRLE